MPLFGFMAIVPTRVTSLDLASRIADLSRLVRQTLVIEGIQGKALADAMGLSESHLSRQLNEQGLNLGRLLNAGRSFWKQFLLPLAELAGLTRDDVMDIFGVKAAAEREAKDKERDEKIALLERQLADVLSRLPPVKSDDSETRVA